ncbi:MAG: Fic family protein [Anaerolineae bacterium]
MAFEPPLPYIPQKLPITDVDWEQLIPLIGQANRALAKYDGVLYGVPNPAVLLSPLTTQEAVLSSRIEGTRATLGEVLRFEAGEDAGEESKRLDIQEIFTYRRALRLAEEELETRPFSLNLLRHLHFVLLDNVRGRDKGRGQFRTTQNWIGAPQSLIEQAYFVPPEPMVLAVYLDNWEKYYHSERPDALVQLAILHAQFEIIHPFLDGNGRLGRMLVPLFLYEKKVLSRPVFYISAYLDSHRDEYVHLLRALSLPGYWNQWIAFFLRALIDQAVENADKAQRIMALYDRLKARVLDLTHSQYAVPLLDLLFEMPILKSSFLENQPGMPSKPMIHSMLNKLKTDGILHVVVEAAGRRAQVLALAELINLCEGRPVI